jgi:predicted O-methyltransferase YrrM
MMMRAKISRGFKMTTELWSEVDRYIADRLLPPDSALDAALAANQAAGLPAIDVSPPQGKLLHFFARMIGARRVLEIGTLGGYSTIWLARALPPDGKVVTLEFSPAHAEVARRNIAAAGVAEKVEVRVGPALETLPLLEREGAGPFDLIFVDADKRNNPGYLEWALKLSRPGSLIVVDNVVRHGRVIDPSHDDDADIQGIRTFFDLLAASPRLTATAIQTVGGKGWDGFALAIVEG